MSFIKTPVKGMSDYLPAEMQLREHVLNMIKQTYAKYGFSQIETPAVEHIENLTGKQGGDNEKLIFKVQKRGEELNRAIEKGLELADSGLRYDLTVPLARYYANNSNALPAPFKAMQIGNVWRADKPQKGRFRQFVQCDIDILGDSSVLAEIELISATTDMLSKIFAAAGIEGFSVKVNDRRILRAMAGFAGFEEADFEQVFITLDKLDKIGLEGVRGELCINSLPEDKVNRFIELLENTKASGSAKAFCSCLDTDFDPEVAHRLDMIIECVSSASSGVRIDFDPTLVRGMGYYTSTVFECFIQGYGFAIAGGGRYDDMIGKFSGQSVSACGFSIGFERIITILKEHELLISSSGDSRMAILIESGVSQEAIIEVLKRANTLREAGTTVSIQPLRKNIRRQLEQLEAEGYGTIERVLKA